MGRPAERIIKYISRRGVFLALLLARPSASFQAKQSPVEGLWLTQGYGQLLEVAGGRLRAFDVTSVSCLPSWEATRQPDPTGQREAIFMRGASSGLPQGETLR